MAFSHSGDYGSNDDYPAINNRSPTGGYALQPAAPSSDGRQYATGDRSSGPRSQRSLGTGSLNLTNSKAKRTMLDSMDQYRQSQRAHSRVANNSSGQFRIHRDGRTQTEGELDSPPSEEGGSYGYRQRNNTLQGGTKSKSITIQSTTFKRKQHYVFTEKEFNTYLKAKALKGR